MLNRFLVLILFFNISCNPNTTFDGFDRQQWQADENGCNQVRASLADNLIERKSELYGLSQNGIVDIFGKPDRHELYARNKKAFVYFIKGGPQCKTKLVKPEKLVVRFDGVGRAQEIILYKN